MPGTVAALLYVRRARTIGRDPSLWTSSSTVATRPAGSVLTATSVMVPGRARPARTVDSSRQVGEERERLHEVAGDEERPAHVLAAGGAHPRDELGVVEQVTGAEGRPFDRVDDVAGHVVDHLLAAAAAEAVDDWLSLPHRLGRGELEADSRRLLQHDRGRALERVDLQVGLRRQLEYDDVRIVMRGLAQVGQDLEALAIVTGGAGQDETDVVMLLDEPVRVHDPDGILSPAEGAHLEQESLVLGHAQRDVVGQGLVGQHPLGAFQRRPQGGRGGVERGVAARDLPARVETEVLEQRHRRAQHLGGAFAEAAAGQVQDPPVAHTVAQALDDVHDPGRRHVTVVVQPNHAACVSRAWSTRPRTRARTRSRLVMNVSMRSMRWARASRPSDVRIHSAKSPDGRPSLARASTMWK